MLAPISWRTPPRHYGPWELVVSLLTEGLVERGVDVTLFATADSVTRARLSAVCPRPVSEDTSLEGRVWESLHIASVFERAAEFDLIHNHLDFQPLTYSGTVRTPVLTTIHGFSSEGILPAYQRYDATTHYVSISDADRHPSLHYLTTIHHGIPLEDFTLRQDPGGYLLFFGRIHPDKGTAEAIEVAARSGRPLIIAGIIHDRGYFEREIEPRVDGRRIRYIGSVGPGDRDRLLGGAYALLHLVNFAEPFGLSMVEAMACGTPVIATPRGSVAEVVADGRSGFIVAGIDEAVQALERVAALDRSLVRQHVAERFSRDRMVDDYVRAYEEVLALQR